MRAQRGPQAEELAPLPERIHAMSLPLIQEVDDFSAPTLRRGNGRRIKYQAGLLRIAHEPANNAPAEHVDDDR
jgi:hypothetical protein